jgi:photosystem II stability/assembly factor-like uncharacterized protein
MRKGTGAIIGFCLIASVGCNQPGVSSGGGAEENASPKSDEVTQTITGFTRIGDSPPADTWAITLQCHTEQICWTNNPRFLWRSDDGGKTWREVFRGPDDEIDRYHFLNDKTGWRVSFSGLSSSEDGGLSWSGLTTPFDAEQGDLRSVWFSEDGKTGWIAGGMYRPQTQAEFRIGVPNNASDAGNRRVLEEAIFRTTDGGLTWQTQPLARKVIGRILQVQFANQTQGIALGEGRALYTADGGESWQPIGLKKSCIRSEYLIDEYEASPLNATMLNSNLWWLSYSDGRIIKTVDGGRTWCDSVHPGAVAFEEGSGRPQFFTKMHFDSSTNGWGLGWDRFLYETKDGGLTWSRIETDMRFFDFAFLSAGRALLISEKGIYRLGS